MTDFCNHERRIILHVDMDHFFSAIEERERPEIKGKPVVVGADPQDGRGRGVVKTCNYEARAFGLRSGMPISKAWQLCPTAVYVRENYQLYKEVSEKIMTILRKYADRFQNWGFDEAFLDVSSLVENFEEAAQLAACIKHEILWHEGLTCSVGIAPNKLVAKIASEFRKPDGLTVVRESEAEAFLAPLPVRKMLWVGEKTEQRLSEMGIKTIGDLARSDVSFLINRFGVMGRRFHEYAHGIYVSEVSEGKRTRKSLGHESTFAVDAGERSQVLHRLDDICHRIHERATKRNLFFKTVTVKIRYGDFETHTHGKTLQLHTCQLEELRKTATELVQPNLDVNKRIRLIGVRVSSFESAKGQKTLS
jgi:DNA polymerase IV (archaeal DinB-like DNA polymerase)